MDTALGCLGLWLIAVVVWAGIAWLAEKNNPTW